MTPKNYFALVADMISWESGIVEQGVEEIADTFDCVYRTKWDESFLCFVNDRDRLAFLAENDVTEELSGDHGFSPTQQKWYGWRGHKFKAFGVGDTCTMHDTHYVPRNREDFAQLILAKHVNDHMKNTKASFRENGLVLAWRFDNQVPNTAMRGKTWEHGYAYPERYGRGEFTAVNLDDAKQMAMDYAAGC